MKTLKSNDFVLVAYVSSPDPKSTALEPEWDAATATGTDKLVSFDYSANAEACREADVESAPEVHLFQDGKRVAKYNGPRRAAAILHFVARLKRPVATQVTVDDLTAFKTADETVYLAFIDAANEAAQKAYADAAKRYYEEFTFGLAAPGVEPPTGVTPPAVVCYKPVDGDSVSFTSFDKPGELDNWIKEASRPVVGELTPANHQRLLDRGWPIVYLFAPTEPERQELRKALYKFAKSYYDSLTTVVADPVDFPGLMEKLGLEPDVYPAGAVHQLSKDRVYPYPKGRPFTASAVQQWGLDVYQGRVKPWTPPGAAVTTSYEDLGATGVKATRRVSIASGWPGVNIRVGGRDEL
ncbi:thioredoxin-like domain-containing protein [Coniochaeta sp. 2T2.1]|nr:thioredoxin-like domain-containing protein [Coniochaeta sp. 2T2.1]